MSWGRVVIVWLVLYEACRTRVCERNESDDRVIAKYGGIIVVADIQNLEAADRQLAAPLCCSLVLVCLVVCVHFTGRTR